MQWAELADEPCPIARYLAVLGDRWNLLIVRQAFRGTRRFEAFRDQLAISPTILNQRLKALCEDEILETVTYHERPPRHEYRLTVKGMDLYPVMMSIVYWGEKHYGHEGPSEWILEHTACGHEFTPTPEARCSGCGETVPPLEVRGYLRVEAD